MEQDRTGDDELVTGRGEVPEADSVIDPSLRYSAPQIAIGHDLADAATRGSARARRRAQVISWIILAVIALGAVVGVVGLLL